MKIEQGQALIIHRNGGEPRVSFTSALVLPFQHGEVLDISVKTIAVATEVRCADAVRATIGMTFYLRVNPTVEDVLRVARSVGCERASSQAGVEAMFAPKLTDAIATVAGYFEFAVLERRRDELKDKVIELVGRDLNGFVLDDAAIDRIEAARLAAHDPDGRGRAESDEVERLRAEVARLTAEVARLTEALASR